MATKKTQRTTTSKVQPLPVVTPAATADPLNINARLYRQIGRLLDDLETEDYNEDEPLDIKSRIAALIAIGRLQTIFVGLRKENKDAPRGAGSAVRKYATAFKNDARRGAARPRPAPADDVAGDPFSRDDDDDTAA